MTDASTVQDLRSLVDKIVAIASDTGAERVVRVQVRVGARSGVTVQEFVAAFEAAAVGSVAEGATVVANASEDGDPHAERLLLESVDVA